MVPGSPVHAETCDVIEDIRGRKADGDTKFGATVQTTGPG